MATSSTIILASWSFVESSNPIVSKREIGQQHGSPFKNISANLVLWVHDSASDEAAKSSSSCSRPAKTLQRELFHVPVFPITRLFLSPFPFNLLISFISGSFSVSFFLSFWAFEPFLATFTPSFADSLVVSPSS